MRVALALALIAVGGCAVERAGDGPDLRAVDAPANGIEARKGALLAALEFGGPARLLLVRPVTLRRVSRRLWLDGQFIADHALSPDGRHLAIGSETHSRIELVDLRRWRSLGGIDLPGTHPGSLGGASGLAWPSARRLLVLSGSPYGAISPMVVDPVARRVVRSRSACA
jgi:hypothetical protein